MKTLFLVSSQQRWNQEENSRVRCAHLDEERCSRSQPSRNKIKRRKAECGARTWMKTLFQISAQQKQNKKEKGRVRCAHLDEDVVPDLSPAETK